MLGTAVQPIFIMHLMSCRRWKATLLSFALALPSLASAQILPLTVPKGRLRFDFWGDLKNYDQRFLNGTKTDAAGEYITSSVDPNFLPSLSDLDTQVKSLTGRSDLALSLGRTQANQLVNLGTAGLGAALGLTRRLTLFGNVPIIQVRVQQNLKLDPTGATLGVNPADPFWSGGSGGAGTAAFFSGFNTAIDALSQRISDGAYDQDPTLKALAQSTLTKAQTMRTDLSAMFLAFEPRGSYLPLQSSAAGQAIVNVIHGLQNTLGGSLGVTGFSSIPDFPQEGVTDAQFQDYLTNEKGPIQLLPLPNPIYTYLGDIELGANYLWLDHFPSDSLGTGIRSTVQGLVRLRTAKLPNPNRIFDVGTGDRQPDLEVNVVTDVVAGRIGARLSVGYNYQMPGNQNRRIARPDQPIDPISALAGVRRDPGDILQMSAAPFFRFAPSFAAFAAIDYYRKGTDKFTYADGQPPLQGLDINDLGIGTAARAALLSGGLSYSHSGLHHDGTRRLPLDASLRWQRVLTSNVGSVPAYTSVMMQLRLYAKVW